MTSLPGMAVALAAAVMLPAIAAAQPPAPQAPPAQGRRAIRPAPRPDQQARQLQIQRFQLTEQQREQLRTFDEQHRAATETARRELVDLQRQLEEALTAAQIDNSKVNQLRASIVQRETLLAQQRIDRRTKLASILTPEQRQAMRGRGPGRMIGPAGGRPGVTARRPAARVPGVLGLGRAPLRQRLETERQLRGRLLQRQPRQVPSRQLRGGRGAGSVAREQLDDARLRAEIRRLEAQLEALRRRVR